MKGIGREPIFVVSVFKGNRFINRSESKLEKTEEEKDATSMQVHKMVADQDQKMAIEKQNKKIEEYTGNVINDSESNDSQSHRESHRDSHRQLMD